MLTPAEAAARLRVSLSTVYALVERGSLGHHRIGARGRGRIVIGEHHLAEYLARTERPAQAEEGPRATPRPAFRGKSLAKELEEMQAALKGKR